jgi:hypothetical protein
MRYPDIAVSISSRHKEHPEEADGMADKIRELQNLMSTELLRLPGIFERELQLKD